MFKYILLTLLFLDPISEVNKIARTNELKKEAKAAFDDKNYKVAIEKYHFLLDSMNVQEENIRMNLANSYYLSGDTANATLSYELLRDSKSMDIASRAYQQLGVIKHKQKKLQEALNDFKQALRKNPANEEARYNYELLKKLLNEQKENQQNQQNQDQQNQDQNQQDQDQQQNQDKQKQNQQNQDQQQDQEGQEEQQDQEQQQQQDQEGKEGDEQDQRDQQNQDEQQSEEQKKEGNPDEPNDEQSEEQNQQNQMNTSPERFKDMKISEEKAQMILEAMKNQEVQYLQQNRRKSKQSPPSDKPDW